VTVFRDTLVNLHLMQRRLQGLQDNALDAIITIDTLGRVIEFNPSAEKLFGYRKDDVQGRSISDLIIPPRFREAHQRGLAHQRGIAASTCVGQRMEVSALRADGSEFLVELTLTTIDLPEGRLFTAFLRDITDHHRIEHELRKLLQVIEQSPTAIMMTNTEGVIEYVNAQFCAATGYGREEAVGGRRPGA